MELFFEFFEVECILIFFQENSRGGGSFCFSNVASQTYHFWMTN